MGTFDIRQDAPGLLRAEALNITLKFERTSPTTGRISWNIPVPAAGCTAETQAFCGIIITLDTTPVSGSKIPVNGAVYSSDPTANSSLFAGDKIGTSSVVGAFYNDRTTTFFDITGLTPNTPYYVSGFPTDCEYRYYKEGVHAYSLDYTNKGTDGTSGTQVVILNSTSTPPGVTSEDFTGLMPGIEYEFTTQIGIIPRPRTPLDPIDCNPAPLSYSIKINGTNASKYKDLIVDINKQFALLDNHNQSPIAPNTGSFYFNSSTNNLYQWNGTENIELPVVIQSTAPNTVIVGTYWYNPTTKVLKKWNGTSWDDQVVISSVYNPLIPTADLSYWFDGTNGYVWNGTTWCGSTTYNQATDPSTTLPTLIGSYWFDNVDTLYKWDNSVSLWTAVDSIQYFEDPNALSVGAYWFDESSNQLFNWDTIQIGWNLQSNLSVTEHEPGTPASGKFWYNPTTQVLKQWDSVLSSWNTLNVISYPYDPTIRTSCELWWNTSTDTLYTWDDINNNWDEITYFYNQVNDPAVSQTLSSGTLWYNTVNSLLYAWVNNCFVLVDFFNYPTDPTSPTIGTVWHNTESNIWKVLSAPSTWSNITPVSIDNDPTSLPVGSYWYNNTNSSLQVWNGVGWMSLLFTTQNPTPTEGTIWFNSTTNELLQWNGVSWILAPVKAIVELDCHGNLLFTDNTIGSLSYITITDVNLFKSLTVPYSFHNPNPGVDGISNQPSYEELNIGTDGSNDQRLLLMNEMRYELGYPVVDVELTNEQLDYAITKALNELRQKSSIGYKRGFFFMKTEAETQRYLLTNKVGGFNKIVDILGIQRLTSSFLSSAHGAGAYGQMILSHLYNMGNFDLLSYHIMTEYTKTMEILFAARLTFTWNEQTRELWIHHRFPYSEPYVSIECSVERTEQDIISDRYSRPWVRRYATAVAKMMLAEIRGKFQNLPGASGSISLNANDLRMSAKEDIESCLAEIDNYVADMPEQFGMATQFVFG
ncbi:MAG: hypothetical protein ACXW2E_01970 [Nitrososphaeraceae archaeon]